MKTESLTIKAPAKINLYLDVLGKREDGYHNIRSILAPVSVCDEIYIEKTDSEIITTVTNGGLKSAQELCVADSESNLATRSAVALRKATGCSFGAKINIKKNIPVGGGLGGGSSDSAAVLNSLNELWQTNVPTEELMKIGATVGCDVPALVHGGAVCMEGVGELVSPLSISKNGQSVPLNLVIINPGFVISTGDIFSRHSSSLTLAKIPFNTIASSLNKGDLGEIAQCLYNDLQETVFNKYPLLRILAEELEKAGALSVLLSGSGASIFGLARDEEHAGAVEEKFKKAVENTVWTKVAKTCPMV